MKKAFSGTVVILVLGLVFLVVMTVFFTSKTAIFTKSISIDSVNQQNERCRALSFTFQRSQEPLTDTDVDGLADICDPCPNNYLSEKGEKINFDEDKDGLSEETDQKLSRHNRNNRYKVHRCDKEVSQGSDKKCMNGWDGVRGKCICSKIDGVSYGWYKDRCATKEEGSKTKQSFYKNYLILAMLDIKNLDFKKAKIKLKEKANIFEDPTIFAEAGSIGKIRRILELYDKEQISNEEYAELQKISGEDLGEISSFPSVNEFMTSLVNLKLEKETSGDDFFSNRLFIEEANEHIESAISSIYPENYQNYHTIREEIWQRSRLILHKGKTNVYVESLGEGAVNIWFDDYSHLTIDTVVGVNGKRELTGGWNGPDGEYVELVGDIWIDGVLLKFWIEYLAAECQWNEQTCYKSEVPMQTPDGKGRTVTIFLPKNDIVVDPSFELPEFKIPEGGELLDVE